MIWHDIQQNTPEWESLRLGRITASQFGTVMSEKGGVLGQTGKDYALKIALERIKGTKSVNQIKTFHMKRGHEQEPIARALYEREYFKTVTNGGFFEYENHGDSPDGLVGDNGSVEIKCVIATAQMATLKRNNYDPVYHWQIVGHLDCTGRDWCDYISYCSDFPEGKQLLVYRVNRKDVEKDIEILASKRIAFNQFVNEEVDRILTIN